MAEVDFAGGEAVRLDGAVGVGGEVAFVEMREGDGLAGGVGECRACLRRLAVMLDEGHDVRAFRQHQQPLLQPHEQVVGLPGLVLGLVLRDFANGKAVQLAAVAEENPVAAVPFLQRRHDSALRSITPMSGQSLYHNFTRGLVKRTRQGPKMLP